MPLLLAVGFLFFYLLESYLNAQPIPLTRARHTRTNLMVSALNFLVLFQVGLATIWLANYCAQNSIGIFHSTLFETPLWIQILLYDLLFYLNHRLFHAIPLLWRVHRCHHSDLYLDVSSAFRFHPLESLVRGLVLSTGIVLFGVSTQVLVTYQAIVVAALFFSHANIRIHPKAERWLKYFLVLPSLHRLHHSKLRDEHDSNFGIGSMVWDHLFRSYRSSRSLDEFTIGLDGYSSEQETASRILLDPF